MPAQFHSLTEARTRTSAKWTMFPPDVLPMPVAEMDVQLAPGIARVLHDAVDRSDTGYPGLRPTLQEAFARFADERWGWVVEPTLVHPCADVSVGVRWCLKKLLPAGGTVVISSPVYPPFHEWPAHEGLQLLDVPLRRGDHTWELDLPGIRDAFASGARVYLLCHPHNPVGAVFSRASLQRLAEMAAEFGAYVIADEIHAPLVLPGGTFTPFLTVSDDAAQVGVAVHSASKAWNLAGLKSAQVVTASAGMDAHLADPDHELLWHAGHFGILAAEQAYQEEEWLDSLLDQLQERHQRVAEVIASELPAAAHLPPQAGYLSWLDLSACGLGDNPADALLEEGKLAVVPGPSFGAPGRGCVRLNVGCHADVLDDALAALVRVAAAS